MCSIMNNAMCIRMKACMISFITHCTTTRIMLRQLKFIHAFGQHDFSSLDLINLPMGSISIYIVDLTKGALSSSRLQH